MDTDKKPEFRELKPGKSFCIGARVYKGSFVKVIKDKKGKEKKEISVSSTCMVPESLIKAHKLPESLFIDDPDKPKPKQVAVEKNK